MLKRQGILDHVAMLASLVGLALSYTEMTQEWLRGTWGMLLLEGALKTKGIPGREVEGRRENVVV